MTDKELFGHFDEKDGVFSRPGFYINEAELVVRGKIIPLYFEAVPGREWVGLTAEEVEKIVDDNTQEHKMIEYTVQVDSHYTKWYLNKKLHREDGPAVEHTNGNKEWYLNGYEVPEESVMKPVKQLTVAEIEALLGHKIEVIAG